MVLVQIIARCRYGYMTVFRLHFKTRGTRQCSQCEACNYWMQWSGVIERPILFIGFRHTYPCIQKNLPGSILPAHFFLTQLIALPVTVRVWPCRKKKMRFPYAGSYSAILTRRRFVRECTMRLSRMEHLLAASAQ